MPLSFLYLGDCRDSRTVLPDKMGHPRNGPRRVRGSSKEAQAIQSQSRKEVCETCLLGRGPPYQVTSPFINEASNRLIFSPEEVIMSDGNLTVRRWKTIKSLIVKNVDRINKVVMDRMAEITAECGQNFGLYQTNVIQIPVENGERSVTFLPYMGRCMISIYEYGGALRDQTHWSRSLEEYEEEMISLIEVSDEEIIVAVDKLFEALSENPNGHHRIVIK